jgi:hypothetical protein
MQRKYGPMPVWAWTALVGSFIAGIMIFRKRMGPSTPTTQGGTSGGPAGEFNSGLSTTTTDAQGNQTTSNYSASGPLTGYPGYLTTQAGAMPFQQGDVYVNTTTPPPATTTNSNPNPDKRTVLNADKFNENGWSATARQSPWTMAVSQLKSDGTPETWKDITARIYGFAKDYASISDTTNKARVDQVATYIRDTNKNYTGEVPDGSGPTPGSVVVYR